MYVEGDSPSLSTIENKRDIYIWIAQKGRSMYTTKSFAFV